MRSPCAFSGRAASVSRAARLQSALTKATKVKAPTTCQYDARGGPAETTAVPSRRDALIAALVGTQLMASLPASAGGMDRYIKRKRTDPLESYIPGVLVAQAQLLLVPGVVESEGLAAARDLLRKGAFVGLRDNVRAIAEFATPAVGAADAKGRQVALFTAIENLDLTIFNADRTTKEIPDNLEELVDAANKALERLLEIVPPDAMLAGQQIVEALAQSAEAIAEPSQADAESAKRLQSLL